MNSVILTGPADVGSSRAYRPAAEIELLGARHRVGADHPQRQWPVVRFGVGQRVADAQAGHGTSRSPRRVRLQDVSMKPFEQVVTAHGATVLRVCRAVLGPIDADDAWSETFLAALQAYPQLGPEANVRAWLVTIAHRKAIDVTRRRRRQPVPVADVPDAPTPASDDSDLDLAAEVSALAREATPGGGLPLPRRPSVRRNGRTDRRHSRGRAPGRVRRDQEAPSEKSPPRKELMMTVPISTEETARP